MRRLASSILVVSLILTVMACGSSDPPRRQAPLTSITRSHAHVVAPLLTIRAADLPEFKVTAHPAAWKEGPHVEVKCPGHRVSTHPLRSLASAKSQYISANSGYHALGAWSYVQIMPTARAAHLEIAEARRRKVCMEHALRSGLLSSAFRSDVRGIAIEPIQVKVSGADTSTAYRAVVAARQAPLVLYIDATLFSYGQDVFVLGTYHSSKPVPPAMEERLQALLIARARSHDR